VVTGHASGAVSYWDVRKGKRLKTTTEAHRAEVLTAVFWREGNCLTADSNGVAVST
jgi:hypothetical protein